MSSLLARTLGDVRSQAEGDSSSRRTSGGGATRGSPYARGPPPADSWQHDMYGSSATDDSDKKGDRPARATPGGAAGRSRSKRLVVSNLHYDVSERELEHLFVQIGPLASPPSIKFDRSGRSTGLAFLAYSTEKEAADAKEAFNGALAKGQNITVEFDNRPERVVPAPGTLLARLDNDDKPRRRERDAGPTDLAPSRRAAGTDPSTRFGTPAARGARGAGATRGGGRGGGERGGDKRGERREKPAAKSGADLDKELEDFMAAPAAGEGEGVEGGKKVEAAEADVDMS